MRITKQLLLCVCCLGIAVPTAWGQAASSQAATGILGYLDTHTGAFRPVPPAVEDDASLPAATVVGGTVTVTITITVKTAGLTNFKCIASVSAFDGAATGSPTIFDESNTVAATGTGSTRTCKLSIPYSWSLTSQATDTMSTSYTVLGSTGATGLPQRTSDRSPLDSRKVPANGAITALTAAVTQ
jgi:hypothetical protein